MTGITTAAIPFGPDSVPSVVCGGVPCGAHQDLLGLAIHELAHALNINSSTLAGLQSGPTALISIGGSNEEVGVMRIPAGPLAGTTLPWTTGGGGHPFLKPVAGLEPVAAPPAGQPANWLDTPNGDIVSNAVFFYGPHRKLVSELDAVLVASVSSFRRVNLDASTYVALPEFAGATTPRAEAGRLEPLMTVNGAATLSSRPDGSGGTTSVLRLTPDAASSAGSAFLTKPFFMTATTSFRSAFSFVIDGTNGDGPDGSDGFAFVIHRDPRGAGAIGNSGEGLGYGRNPTFGDSVPGIRTSLAIEFDTHRNAFDPDDNHVAFLLDGNVDLHQALFSPDFLLNDGLVHFAWIEYDGLSDLLSLYLSDTDAQPDRPVLTRTIDLAWLLGSDVYFGFTGGTGDGFNTHDILSWNLEVTAAPTSDTLVLLTTALLGLGVTCRGRRAPWTRLRRAG